MEFIFRIGEKPYLRIQPVPWVYKAPPLWFLKGEDKPKEEEEKPNKKIIFKQVQLTRKKVTAPKNSKQLF